MITINIAQDFADTPGGRYIKLGPNSGEEFREKVLLPYFEDKKNKEEIVIILDGTYGYPTSFTDEAFGGLARKYGKGIVKKRLRFVSDEDPLLINEINKYINEA